MPPDAIPWIPILAAIGTAAAAWTAAAYRFKRVITEDRRKDRAATVTEKVENALIEELRTELARVNAHLQQQREQITILENKYFEARTATLTLTRRLARLGRRSDITDLGLQEIQP